MKADDLLLHLEAYIALQSALGFSLRARERLLRNFVAFVQASGTMGPITAQIAPQNQLGEGSIALAENLTDFTASHIRVSNLRYFPLDNLKWCEV